MTDSSTFLRPVRVFLRLFPFIISFLRDWQRFVFFGDPRILTEAQHRRRAKDLTSAFAELGPSFIKGAQVLAMREDLLPRTYTQEFKTLQDRVPPFPVDEAIRAMARAFGQHPSKIFESFDREPIAAASLGQVHRARYKGHDVAVKILRPGVEKLVETDLAVINFIIKLFYFFIDHHFIRNFWIIHREFTRMIRREMDFRNEQTNADRLRTNFANDPRVHVPLCHDELTTRRTVVFDFVEGVRVDDPAGLDRVGLPPTRLIATMIEVYVRMTIVHGFIHADPHPGNLLVDEQGRLVILDYGMALAFEDEVRLELLRACLAVVRRDIDGLVDCFYKLDLVDPDINRALVRDAAETMLKIQLRSDFTPRMVQEIADDILATFHKFPLRMPEQLVYLFRASALVEGLGMMYDPNFSGVREATPIIKQMIKEIALEQAPSIPHRVKEAVESVGETVRYLRRVIVRMEREEQRLRLHQGDVQEMEKFAASLMRRLLAGFATIAFWMFVTLLYVRTGWWWLLVILCPAAFLAFLLILWLPIRRKSHLK